MSMEARIERTAGLKYDGAGLAALAGILSIAPGVVGVLISRMWEFPATGADAAEILAFVDANRTVLLVDMYLTTATVALWLVFGVGVWLRLREETGGESLPTACFLVGVIGFVTLLLAGFTSLMVLFYLAPEAPSPRLLYNLSFGLLAMSGIPTALALGSYAALVRRADGLPRWTASIAVAAALAHLVIFASLAIPSGFFSLDGGVTIAVPALLFAWVLATSIALLRRRPQASV